MKNLIIHSVNLIVISIKKILIIYKKHNYYSITFLII